MAIRGWLKASLLVVGRLNLGSCGGDRDRGLWRHGGERLGPGIRWNRDLTVSVLRKFLSSFWMDDRTRVDVLPHEGVFPKILDDLDGLGQGAGPDVEFEVAMP